jgi:hypothetical protein
VAGRLTPRDDDPAGQIGQYLIELGEKTADTAVMIEALQPFARGWEMLMEGSDPLDGLTMADLRVAWEALHGRKWES